MNKFVLCFYIFILLCFTLFSYLFIDPNFIYLKPFYSGIAFSQRMLITIMYTSFITLFFLCYVYFLKTIKEKKQLFLLIILSSVLLFSYPAILSYDIFNYVATARVAFFYHENPYLVMPIEFSGDKMLLFTRAVNKFALYGPSWIFMSAIPFFFGFGNYLLILFGFKVFVFLFYLGTVYLIYKLSKNNLFAVIFFALNPLVILETFASGHNDIVMMFFALMGFYLVKKKMILFSLMSFIMSVFIKYSTVFLLVPYLFVVYNNLRGKNINWNKIWFWSGILMFLIFLLSPLREEMYPWYAIWFMPFIALYNNKTLKTLAVAFTFGLLLSYIPYMLLGTYNFPTPQLRILFSSSPLIVIGFILFFRDNLVNQ